MSLTIAEGKFPKKPAYGSFLEICRKDFRNFKRENGIRLMSLFNSRIKDFSRRGMNIEVINEQKDNLERVRKLIKDGRDDIAFSLFFRTFPTCLPHRTRRQNLKSY